MGNTRPDDNRAQTDSQEICPSEPVYLVNKERTWLQKKAVDPTYRVSFNDCLFSFTYQIAIIIHFWYKICGKIFICVGHLMNSDLK